MTPDAARAGAGPALERIKEVVGPVGWTADAGEMAPYLVEPRGRYRGRAALVVRPASTDEVAAVVGICADAAIPIVPQGGNTGLVGGAVPHEHGGEIVLGLARMNAVRAVDPENDTITVEAGCVLADVQAAAAAADRLFPLSLAAEGSCQIGGNLSTNAGGTAVVRYGSARALALGLEVVLPDGAVWDGLRGLYKDNSGYDLKHIFIGAEGTLGIITAAVLRLFPRPRDVRTALIAVADPGAAVELYGRARRAVGDAVCVCELIPRIGLDLVRRHIPDTRDPLAADHPWYVLLELTTAAPGAGLGEALEAFLVEAAEDGIARDATIAASVAQARALWRLREALPEALRLEGRGIKHDVSVPLSRIADFIAEATSAVEARLPGVRTVAFGHLGDGNIHFNQSAPTGADSEAFLAETGAINRVVHDIAAAMGGSFSAEHGIGRMKRGDLERYRSAVEVDLMRRLKATLDPRGIMNPGKVL